jgi:hypothetical protein
MINQSLRLQFELCMGIIVANGPALKVWYNVMSRNKVWCRSLPKVKLVWNTSSENTRPGGHVDLGIVPRISTFQASGFGISQLRAQVELSTPLQATASYDDSCSEGYADVLNKPERAYYGV